MLKKNSHLKVKPKVKGQIILIFLLAIIFPAFILGGFSIRQVRKQMLEHYQSQVHADGIRVNSILFDLTTSMYTSLNSILNNRSCMKLFGLENLSPEDTASCQNIDEALATLKNQITHRSNHVADNKKT